ncbi:hypothetical protein [Arthrobacter sp. H35-D1]|uniref:hypothetical protein n=1 Tax=Arthrobacter sp. H35-D1 TaxID=3046202 RepID=UPI0024B89E57|nr:hypothetical protein [Arthrobacter sp. H35-D1]MDJ0313699.1 hypothetical protein [Arthrobacter sp. H35-D1]
MRTRTSDFELTMGELRVVARHVAEAAQEVLLVFEAATESVRLAARTAGDAAAAAYLHPIAKATQVAHILRGPASAARIAELVTAEDPEVGGIFIERAKNHATPVLIDVLRRYPIAPKGKNRVAHLMSTLDSKLRESRWEYPFWNCHGGTLQLMCAHEFKGRSPTGFWNRARKVVRESLSHSF